MFITIVIIRSKLIIALRIIGTKSTKTIIIIKTTIVTKVIAKRRLCRLTKGNFFLSKLIITRSKGTK